MNRETRANVPIGEFRRASAKPIDAQTRRLTSRRARTTDRRRDDARTRTRERTKKWNWKYI